MTMVVKKKLLNITKQIKIRDKKKQIASIKIRQKKKKKQKKDYNRNRYKKMKENANLFLQYKDE